MRKLCCDCRTRVARGNGKRCRLCQKNGHPDAFPMPLDMDRLVAECDAQKDPLAVPLVCRCGRETQIESRWVPRLCESRCFEVCPQGHVTLMRTHGTHTYDQHERAAAERVRMDDIVKRAKATARRNGVRPGFRGWQGLETRQTGG